MPRDDWPGEETQVLDPMVEALDQVDEDSNGAGPAAFSVLDRLKAQHGKIAQGRTFDLDVPGTHGLLVLRLGVLPRQRLSALTQRAAKTNGADFNLNADTLIAACVEVLARNSREEPLQGIGLEGEKVRIDERLAGLLGMPDATRSREVLEAVFAYAPSPDLAIGVACGQYMEWASATADEVDEEFVGESQAAPT
jgi:hypothetical protein